MILMLLASAAVFGSPSTDPQTDWYGRGIIRQQTIGVGSARRNRRQHEARQRRRARRNSRAHNHKH
jgi:hypothetical protein